ncbi:MAG: hypothetical protein J5920_00060 [Candidatus Methanomethylophilaceae archaeon]|nr:hypothetical protein [Candidatus Methanomethylophilaceae archaeon]
MSKITMAEVYRKLDIQAYDIMDEAKARGEDLARFDFKDFSRAMRADDFITTQATLKAKWDSALADGVIVHFVHFFDLSGHNVLHVLMYLEANR